MDRLTARYRDNRAVPARVDLTFAFDIDDETYLGLADIFDRLADYEETGLKPEEIEQLQYDNQGLRANRTIMEKILEGKHNPQDKAKIAQLLMENAQYKAIGTAGELTSAAVLVEALNEGKVVVLDMPRKPLVWGDDNHDTCLCPDCGEDLMGIPYGERVLLQCPVCGQYLDATKIVPYNKAKNTYNEADIS